jgi:hypothetical protein
VTFPTRQQFEAEVSTAFHVVGADGVNLQLSEVRGGRSSADLEQFSAYFRSDPGVVFAQGAYLLRHDALGDVEIFLVPIDRDGDSLVLEAAVATLTRTATGCST